MRRGGARRLFLGSAVASLALTGCQLPRWPVDARATSGFGFRMMGAWPGVHHGVDFPVPVGTPVHAMAAGRVRFAGVMSGFGNVVWLDHGGGTLSVYAHLSTIAVAAGSRIGKSDVVGASGATGNATTPHVHFEVWRWGRPVDPIPMLGGLPRR